MSEPSARRRMLEASLSEDPHDPFLRYGLALQYLREGETELGRAGLKALIADRPEDQIAAYQQLGQSYVESEEYAEARHWLELGIARARAAGDSHAAREMQGLFDLLP